MQTLNDLRLAVLIDADNIPYHNVKGMIEEITKYGTPTFKRIYGDWTKPTVAGWKSVLLENAITPVQQYSYTKGKNSTDSAMIIDAMDILYSGKVDGFCIVSSDSDYTRLATRIREIGFYVMGIGKRSTPRAFVNACNIFIYTENLVPREPRRRDRGGARKTEEREDREDKSRKFDPVPLLRGAFDMAVHEDGWANLGELGFYLRQLDPGFDPRTYGFKQLSQLVKSQPALFEVRAREEAGGGSAVYVKVRESRDDADRG